MVEYNSELSVKIRKKIVQALADYNMIEEGDKVLVCVSGGKDSSILLALLKELQRRAPYNYTIEAAILDQGHPGFDPSAFKTWVESLGVKLNVISRDTYSVVKSKIDNGVYCSLCSRLRRAILYDFAFDNGFTKVALGHHRDDLNETLMLNLMYTGKLCAMPPKLKSDDGRNILIRPLSYVPESDLIELSKSWAFPIIPCNLCGSQDGMKRQKVKKLLNQLAVEIPDLGQSMLTAQQNIKLSQLGDQQLFDFKNLNADPVDSDAPGSHLKALSAEIGH